MNAHRPTIIFIVEGASEQVALELSVSAYFAESNVRFHIVHGDITSDRYSSPSNIVARIAAMVRLEMRKYGLRKNDILAILHLTDTDGAFIDEGLVKQSEDERITYLGNSIEAMDPDAIIRRNRSKRAILLRLMRCFSIAGMPYRAFYMSCNLDHVIGSDPNASGAMKQIHSERFRKEYREDQAGFLRFFSSVMPPVEDYRSSWDFIQHGCNSLQRYSNLWLLFAQGKRLLLMDEEAAEDM